MRSHSTQSVSSIDANNFVLAQFNSFVRVHTHYVFLHSVLRTHDEINYEMVLSVRTGFELQIITTSPSLA